ncbi:sulfotransferase family protein [Georgenia halophila]|uniref:Sulfotransferase family protein n=1 Tax=Georgenia halophila TaxID=620889 RepID=A0ABP8LP23_9MICO
MDVVGAGLGRTGTLSVKTALERLGYTPCHHMTEAVRRGELAERWARVLAGEPVPWHEIFAGYRSTVDWPAAARWREIVDAYPDARVLLTVRDPDRWYDSMSATILAQAYGDSAMDRAVMSLLRVLRPSQSRLVEELRPMLDDFFHGADAAARGRMPTRAEAVAAYERHVREVQAHVPADRLLTFDVRDGWEPLCAFLGVDVPDEPFPKVNDSASFAAQARRMMAGPRARSVLAAAASLAALVVAAASVAIVRRREGWPGRARPSRRRARPRWGSGPGTRRRRPGRPRPRASR